MIFDKTLQFSNAQAITVDAASTNLLDLLATGTPYGHAAALKRDLGKGVRVPLLVQVVTTFATLTSLTIKLQGSVDEAFTSPVDIYSTGAVPVATLVAGYQMPIDFFPRGTIYRFLRMYYDVTGSDATAGKITAGVVAAVQSGPAY